MINFILNDPVALFVAIAWTIAWKGVALWKAARAGSKLWYIALLVVNTLGIFEIFYIFVFSRSRKDSKNQKNND